MTATAKASIFDGMKYLYAEQLKGKRVELTIKAVKPEKVIGDGGRESKGFAMSFNETDKVLIVTGATVRRQLAMACGTEEPDAMVGKRITIYPVASTRSVSGQAIRVAIPEHLAQ